MRGQSSDEPFADTERALAEWMRTVPEQVAAIGQVAEAWVADNPPSSAGYSTALNPFMWLAERAYFDACDRWKAAHPESLAHGPRRVGLPRKGFHLYRLWAQDDRLLYVGVSTRLNARIKSHSRSLGDLIARVTWEEHPSADAMLAAEREAIRDECPALNKAGIG